MIVKIKIGNKYVGDGEKTYIIAEAGSNHDGKINQAKKLIDIAKESGTDAVKFQIFKADTLYSKSSPLYKEVKRNEIPRNWLPTLVKHAKRRNITFLASPFDKEAIDVLFNHDVPAIKWASSEIVNLPLLRYAALKGKTIILSTGMSNIADIYEAIQVIKSTGNNNIILMQCTSLYPAKPNQMHLNVINTFKKTFQIPIGLSDHSLGIIMPALAVCMGANIIEKHFTISRKLNGPDHSYAIEPAELKLMVEYIRSAEESLGSPVKEILPSERIHARRESIFAKKNIKKSEVISSDNIIIDRPAKGIEPRYLRSIIGITVKTNIKKGTPITWDALNV